MKNIKYYFYFVVGLLLVACNGNKDEHSSETDTEKKPSLTIAVPDFNADSAYHFIDAQVAFGPRPNNTPAHDKVAEYLVNKLKEYTEHVETQHGTVKAYNGTPLRITNIFGQFYPERTKKILLVAHYDTRPFADQDTIDQHKPILGANDGASGVGVILEIARLISQNDPGIGVTVFFTDAEDYGAPEDDTMHNSNNTYCLGTQYWAEKLNPSEYIADYGIVLDMVGAKDARFLEEANSLRASKDFVYRVWSTAYRLGYYNNFIMNQTQYGVIDDHVYITQLAGIPTIDIIDYDPTRKKGFGDYWHTHQDDMSIIDKGTLKAVGQTVLTVLFEMNK